MRHKKTVGNNGFKLLADSRSPWEWPKWPRQTPKLKKRGEVRVSPLENPHLQVQPEEKSWSRREAKFRRESGKTMR